MILVWQKRFKAILKKGVAFLYIFMYNYKQSIREAIVNW